MANWRRMRNLLRSKDVQADLEEELQTHYDFALEEAMSDGMSEQQARQATRRRFGNHLSIREQAYKEEVFEMPEQIMRNARQAYRQLRRSPAFTLHSILTLALGIGTTTSICTLVYEVLLKPLPFNGASQIVTLQEKVAEWTSLAPALPVSANHFSYWRRNSRSFESMALMQEGAQPMGLGDHPEQTGVLVATPGIFTVLRVSPALGRSFTESEAVPGRDNVALLTDALWRNRFQADARVVGKTIQLSGISYVVIGVMARSFYMPDINATGSIGEADKSVPLGVIVPLSFSAKRLAEQMGDLNYFGLGRLRDGVTVGQATDDLNRLQGDISHGLPAGQAATLSALVTPFQQQLIGNNQRPLLLLLGAVAGLLFVSCVNIANLLFARAIGQRQQTAIVAALGANRAELLRVALREVVLLATVGGGVGIVLAAVLLPFMQRFLPSSLAFRGTLHLGWAGCLFCVVVTVLSAVLAGAGPAWLSLRLTMDALLPGEARLVGGGRGVRTTRNVLVGLEVAISIVLLSIAGLLTASMIKLLHVPRGFSSDQSMTAMIDLPHTQYPNDQHRAEFYRELLTRFASVPGVEQVAITSVLPLAGDSWGDSAQVAGDPRPIMQLPTERFRWVSPQYASALHLPLLSGRFISDGDWGHNVAVISEKAAKTLWPDRDPVGRQFRRAGSDDLEDKESFIVVGVVENARTITLAESDPMMIYVPYWYRCDESAGLIVHTRGSLSSTVPEITHTVWGLDRFATVSDIVSLGAVVSSSVANQRFLFSLALLFATGAFSLAALGVFAVVNYSVVQRRREMALRLAFGASRADIYGLVFRGGLPPVCWGILSGLAAALVTARLISSLLFGVSPYDPSVLVGAVLLLLLTGASACLLPARGASILDPAHELRSQ